MLTDQVYVFIGTIIIGMAIGVIFDFFRALRRNGKVNNILVYIQDIIFWIVVAIIIIVSSFLLNDGQLRAFMLMGYILGGALYIVLFSKIVKKFFCVILDSISDFFDLILTPFDKFVKKIQKNKENKANRQDI